MRLLIEKIEKSERDQFNDQHGIEPEKAKPDHSVCSIGWSEKEKKYYGWSHRARVGFSVGDKIFEPDFGDDNVDYRKHGSKTIKNKDDARKSAMAFAAYVS
jgi:hypothetical protein